jgi:hypothetical protein
MTRNVPEKFLDQINVGHDHSPAAVPSAAKLVHSITSKESISQRRMRYIGGCHTHLEHHRPKVEGNVPKGHRQPTIGSLVKDHTYHGPKKAAYLATGETTDGDNHFSDST